MTVYAVITARGKSKRILNKNLLDLDGHPLVAWSIAAASISKNIDRVIVSTDSKEIENISLEYGSEVSIRPDYLSGDYSSSYDVIKYMVDKEFEFTPEFIVLLQPTSPLREINLIDQALGVFKNCIDHNYAVEVIEFNANFAKIINKKLIFETQQRTQDLAKRYFPSGRIFIYKTSDIFFKKEEASIMPLIGPQHQFNINIDEKEDYELLKLIYENRKDEFSHLKNYLDDIKK